MSDRSRLGTALLLSLLLHLALFLASERRLASPTLSVPQEFLEVALVDLPPPAAPVVADAAVAEPAPAAPPAAAAVPESRIVPMPAAGVELPSEEARYLSDRDNVVPEEALRRGDAMDSGGERRAVDPLAEDGLAEDTLPEDAMTEDAVPEDAVTEDAVTEDAVEEEERARADVPALPAPEPVAPQPDAQVAESHVASAAAAQPAPADDGARRLDLADLMPRPGDLAAAPRRQDDPPGRSEPPRPDNANRDLMPGRRLRFSTGRGSAVLLPNVRDGDVTLLNTKAHEFAPFVRRVATRVFQHLQIQLLDAARAQVAGSGEEHGLVRATMSADGRFLHATLVDARSDTRLSAPRVLLHVVGPRTFFDDNPPPGARAEDGLIHFDLTIHLRVWSENYADGAGRRLPPTMFEGYFGTGLK